MVKITVNLLAYIFAGFACPPVSCTFSSESIVSQTVSCMVESVLEFSTTCSYDGQPAQSCSLSFLLNYLDFEPGDHTLFLVVTATDGQTDSVTVSFTTPLRLVVTCSIANNFLTCDSSTEVSTQTCSFDGMPQIECASPYDIRPLDLDRNEHSVTVFITDIYGQSDEFSFDFTTLPTGPIVLSFPNRLSVMEGSGADIPALFSISGQAVDDIPFSLVPLTYQMFEQLTGQSVSSVFSNVPSAAVSGTDFDGNAQSSFNFVTSSEAITTEYDVGSLVIDDDSLEQEEGFVLYFDFDQSQISIDDYSRLQTGTRAILVTITDNDALMVTCTVDGGLMLTASCDASRSVVSRTCSIDGQPPRTCAFPIDIVKFEPGPHNLLITVTGRDGQTASDTVIFTTPPRLTASCGVSERVLTCSSSNNIESVYCLFDSRRPPLLVLCSSMYNFESLGLQVGFHTVTVFFRDEFTQTTDVTTNFTIISDLRIECEERNDVVTEGGIDCQSTGGIGSVTFMCSSDGAPAQTCVFPIVLDLFEFTAEEHTLTITATDSAGQPSSYVYTFSGIPSLTLTCSVEENILTCNSSNDVATQSCTFDGQQAVDCSFPLEIIATGLRLGDHNVTVSTTDVFTQPAEVFLSFTFALGPIEVSFPVIITVIEGVPSTPVHLEISGQAIADIPFSISPLTYGEFEIRSGLNVTSIFSQVSSPANPDDFSGSAFNFNFEARRVTPEPYVYNALLQDDIEDESVEGFILYFEFDKNQINSDDYDRLNRGTGAILVNIIDNDGLKVSCEQRFESSILLSVTCTASNQGVETDLVETTCSYDGKTADPCSLAFTINILDFEPGAHTLLVMVRDEDAQLAADTVMFTTPPLLRVTCSVNNNIFTCNSNNDIAVQTCRFDNGPAMPCQSPFNITGLGLPLGPHSLSVMIVDMFEQMLTVPVEFTVKSDLMIVCVETMESTFMGAVNCWTTGGIGAVAYSCSYDGGPAEECANSFPISFNFFEFTQGQHNVLVVVTDSAGESKSYMYNFIGRTPEDYVLRVESINVFVNEDGRRTENSDVVISETGYSFGDVRLNVRPLTYSEYRTTIAGRDLDEIFPRQPAEASESDFDVSTRSITFTAGLNEEAPKSISGSTLPRDDSKSESTEGFVLFLEVDENSLDLRDAGRVSIEGERNVILVFILDDGDEDEVDDETIFGFSPNEIAGLVAGFVVLILVLLTLLILLCVCLILWRRRREGRGIFRSRFRESKASQSSERRIFHAAR